MKMVGMTMMVKTICLMIFIASPLPASSIPRMQYDEARVDSLNSEPLQQKSDQSLPVSPPEKNNPPLMQNDLRLISSPAPNISRLVITPVSQVVPPSANKSAPNNEKDNPGNKLDQNVFPVPSQGNDNQSNQSNKESTAPNFVDTGRQSDVEKMTINRNITDGTKLDRNNTGNKDHEENSAKVRMESEVKNKSSENIYPSTFPGGQGAHENKSSNENITTLKNQTNSMVSPTVTDPVISTSIKQGQKGTAEKVNQSSNSNVTPSTTTRRPIMNNNIMDIQKPPLANQPFSSTPSPGDVNEENNYQQEEHEPPLIDDKVVSQIDSGGKFSEDEDSHFFAYFLTIVVTAIIFYLVFHNKQRIIALIIEGRAPRNRSRRDSSRARYHKLDNNLEEAMSGTMGPKYERIY